jgi:hypothetical protein
VRDGRLIPYVEVALERGDERDAIANVTVGPRNSLELLRGPLRLELHRANRRDVELFSSDVPYRV